MTATNPPCPAPMLIADAALLGVELEPEPDALELVVVG